MYGLPKMHKDHVTHITSDIINDGLRVAKIGMVKGVTTNQSFVNFPDTLSDSSRIAILTRHHLCKNDARVMPMFI